MARAEGCMRKISLLSRGRMVQAERNMSKLVGTYPEAKLRSSDFNHPSVQKCDNEIGTTYWMPESRTGIYVPKGQERVMEDVPLDAASLEQTYWLRNIDGVDSPHSHYIGSVF